ncbi:MAG: diguanylate cyclase, partial [Marmoricola sp.]|nr:diguanylate cyclase [Marmoricola sp.]
MHTWSSIILLDTDGTIEWANPMTEAVFGWENADLVGQRIGVLFADEGSRDTMTAICARAVAGERQASAQLQARRLDGDIVEVEVSTAPFTAADENHRGISLVIRDVTEGKVRALELARLHDWLRSSFVQSEMPQALLDLEGRFLDLNDALARLLGRARHDLLGTPALELLDVRDPMRTIPVSELTSADTSDTQRYEAVGRHATGKQVPMRLDVTVLRDISGRASGVTFFAQDLNDVHDAERRLAAQQAFYQALNRRAWDVALVA